MPPQSLVPLHPGGARADGIDVGRLVMAPLIVLFLLANGERLVSALSGRLQPVAAVGALLTGVFYVVVGWCYLRRTKARATSTSRSSHLAAIVASWGVFVFPVLPHGRHGAALGAAADALLFLGLSWSVWSLRTLGRSFSVLAQARSVVSAGPYRVVRHPLYLGEIVSSAGLALTVAGWQAAVTWTVLVLLQVYRSVHEERVLSAHLPDYAGYQARTRRLIPGIL